MLEGISDNGYYASVLNCYNYGDIVYFGKTTEGYGNIGGLVGNNGYGMFKNSVSAGLIKVSNSSTSVRTDVFVGYFEEYNNIINCYWNENIAYDASHAYYLSNCAKSDNNFVLN